MFTNQGTPNIPLPKGSKQYVRSAVLHVITREKHVLSGRLPKSRRLSKPITNANCGSYLICQPQRSTPPC